MGLSKPADASAPFDHDSAIKALLPAYTELLTQLKALGVPEVQMHEPILTTSDASKLKAEFESSYSELSKVGVPLNLVSALFIPLAFFNNCRPAETLEPAVHIHSMPLMYLSAGALHGHGFPFDCILVLMVFHSPDHPGRNIRDMQAKCLCGKSV